MYATDLKQLCSLHEDVTYGRLACLCVFKMWNAMKHIWISVIVEVYIKCFWINIILVPVNSIQPLVYTKLKSISINFLQGYSFYRTFMHDTKYIACHIKMYSRYCDFSVLWIVNECTGKYILVLFNAIFPVWKHYNNYLPILFSLSSVRPAAQKY
jgi:hypothetical protein